MRSTIWRCPFHRVLPLAALGILGSASLAADTADAQLAAEVRAALERATAFMRSIATEGGYPWWYAADLSSRAGEDTATPTQIWVQAPGTPAMGQAFLRAFEVTGDARYLDAARDAAWALVRGQLKSGGWDYLIEFELAERRNWNYRMDSGKAGTSNPDARNLSSYDDDNTQSALRFLMAYLDAAKMQPHERDTAIRDALDYGLAKIIEAQYPIGAWPQRWNGQTHDQERFPVLDASLPDNYAREHTGARYYEHYTFNDGTHRDMVATLIEAWRRLGRDEYRDAARRGAHFLLRAQLPEPQPVWAQQYNARMEPDWARAFEPPAITAGETSGVVRLLLDLYREFDDERYFDAVPPAIAWLERSQIEPGLWARMYELHTNRPIYGDRDGRIHYTVEELSGERQTGYRWQGEFSIPSVLRYYERVVTARETGKALGRPQWTRSGSSREDVKAVEVREIIAALDDDGRWISTRRGQREFTELGGRIEIRVFIANVEMLCDYLAAQPRAGVREARSRE